MEILIQMHRNSMRKSLYTLTELKKLTRLSATGVRFSLNRLMELGLVGKMETEKKYYLTSRGSKVAKLLSEIRSLLILDDDFCPVCGSRLIREEGCVKCVCGYSVCG